MKQQKKQLNALIQDFHETYQQKPLPNFLYSSIVELFQSILLKNAQFFFSSKDINRISLLGYKVESNTGPQLDAMVNFMEQYPEYKSLAKLAGVKYAVSLGQGCGIREGLFGPFPFADTTLRSLVFSRKYEEPSIENHGCHGGNYYLICIIYNSELNQLFFDHNAIENLCYDLTDSIELVEDIDNKFLSNLLYKFNHAIVNSLNITQESLL